MALPLFDFAPLPAELASRIAAARKSASINPCASDLLDTLVNHPLGPRAGREKAVSISALQSLWGRTGVRPWNERSVKGAAKLLREQCFVPIGASRRAGSAGYYLITEDSEAESTVRVWSAEIRSLARACRSLSPNTSYVRGLLGQISAELQEENATR